VIDAVVSPVDHNKFDPVAVNVDEPQPSVTVTIGADGTAVGLATADPLADVHPPTV